MNRNFAAVSDNYYEIYNLSIDNINDNSTDYVTIANGFLE